MIVVCFVLFSVICFGIVRISCGVVALCIVVAIPRDFSRVRNDISFFVILWYCCLF